MALLYGAALEEVLDIDKNVQLAEGSGDQSQSLAIL